MLVLIVCGCVTSGPTIEEPVCAVISESQHDTTFVFVASEFDTNKIETKEKI